MAVPKRKHSKARRDKRRNNVWKIEALFSSNVSSVGR